jgi:hypothetical protein
VGVVKFLLMLCVLAFASLAYGEEQKLRDMSTDRPDQTESPYTVDRGHIQIETSLLDFSRDRHNPEGSQEQTDTYTFVETNFKIGILDNADLQFVVSPYIYERFEDQDTMEKKIKRGFGDTTVRLKVNAWGNDEGTTAFGVMPFVKVPTNGANLGHESYESGLILPLAVSLPHEWGMGLMA